jgi:aldose 1-epimerase
MTPDPAPLAARPARRGLQLARRPYAMSVDGEPADVFTLANSAGMEVRFVALGGIILSISAPDRDGTPADVTLGYETLDDYVSGIPYVGAIIGRYANRIARGRFTLDGQEYALARNDGPHHLHGGTHGFDRVPWAVAPFHDEGAVGATLTYTSRHGEEGYPGTVHVSVTYTLGEANELRLDYQATTDAPTPVNLAQHTYFNLAGDAGGDARDHELTIHASRFTPVDGGLVPTGEIRDVQGTAFDFRQPAVLGARAAMDDEQLARAGGFDHNFVLDRREAGALEPAAVLHDPRSGRTLEILTTEPGLQLFPGSSFDGRTMGKHGRVYRPFAGVALETQHFPASPNHPGFPDTILRPGHPLRSTTLWRFRTGR